MKYSIAPGVFDILPCDPKDLWKSTHLWQHVERHIHAVAHVFGYGEIRTPLFERTELFVRSVGEFSDIVTKEMYSFVDRGERSMTLRPEGTAPVMRAYIEKHLEQESRIQKLYYIAPMFRYERQQAGRYRQHHQFGAEAIGNDSPEQDAEMIDLLLSFYRRLGLQNLQLEINSLGETKARDAYRNALKDFLTPHLSSLSPESQHRFESNPLRILDSKNPRDQEILSTAPSILDYLSPTCQKHFFQVQDRLQQLDIPFVVNSQLVRGLDYYNNTVFEVVAGELGAQNSLGGGGRYDGLLASLGGPSLPAIGFGTGIERVIQTLIGQQIDIAQRQGPTLFLIPLDEEMKTLCFSLLHKLREHNIPAQMDFSGRKLGKVMSYADHINAKFVAVVGEEEMTRQRLRLKEMKTGEEHEYPIADIPKVLRWDVQGDHILSVFADISKPFSSQSEMDYFAHKIHTSIDATSAIQTDFIQALETVKDILGEEVDENDATNT